MLKRISIILLGLLLLFSLAGCQKQKKHADTPVQQDPTPLIYWNIDGHTYSDLETFTNTRQPEEDGLYHMQFFRDGKVVELTCADSVLVKKIDFNSLVALDVEDGKIMAIADLNALCAPWPDYHISKIDGNTITAVSSVALSGRPPEFEIDANTQIYDVSPDAEVYGCLTEPDIMDRVTILQDPDGGPATHIYIDQRPIKADVYWRVDETPGQVTWDKGKQCTTRVPDENGVYTIRMAKDGQQVDVLCKDLKIVNKIDSLPLGKQAIGLHIDEDGFADCATSAVIAIRGTLQADQWDVTAIEGDDISVLCNIPSSIKGASDTFRLAPDCRIYDTTGSSGPVGIQVDSLQLNDRIMFFCNADREVVIAYITQRPAP